MQPDPSPPPSQPSNYSENKSTRKYVKTGKYSKKKQQQQQQQIQAAIQQQIQATLQQRQQPLTPQQILALQQSLQDAAVNGTVHTASGTHSPVTSLPLSALSPQTLATSSTLLTPPQTGGPDIASVLQNQQLQLQQQQQQQLQASSLNVPLTSTVTTHGSATAMAMTTPADITTAIDPMIRLLTMDGNATSKRSQEVDEQHVEVKKRCMEALAKDHEKVSHPNYITPFQSIEDAMERLLPYHIYQYPASDLDANKVPLNRQDQTMLDIYKCQKEVFEKHGKLINKKLKEKNNIEHQILLERLVSMDMRQRINEEQARIGEEQRAQQQALRIQAEAEKARALQEHQNQHQHQSVLQQQQLIQQQQQQYQYQQQQSIQQPQHIPSEQHSQLSQSDQPLDVKYAQTLHALMQNKEFAEQYQKLTPELRQQFLLNLNHDKVAEFLKRSS